MSGAQQAGPAQPGTMAARTRAIAAALGSLPGPVEAAYFGSVAGDEGDAWSDIDLIVCASSAAAATFLEALNALDPIGLHAHFSDRAPSGRYWFTCGSPFLRLDVSFHDPTEYRALLERGDHMVGGPFRGVPVGEAGEIEPAPLPQLGPSAQHFARQLRTFQDAAKRWMRGGGSASSVAAALAEAERAAAGVDRAVAEFLWRSRDIYTAHMGARG